MSDPTSPESLEEDVRGSVLRAGDDGYDEARSVWNARFDRRPEVVVRAARAEDVAAALRYAHDRGLEVSVKGGGHSYAGNTVGEGGLLVDLGRMSSVRVDPDARRAVVGGGARWRDVDAATQGHGLATTGGTVSTVGVAGFTLGGGSGWLTRKHGLAVDNLLGATVVTAGGEIVRADEDENPGLFWALRGGSGNFGIVTSFEFQLHEVGPEVLAGQVFYPVDRAPELLRLYRDYFRDAPNEVTCFPFFIRVPPLEVIPDEFHGQVALDFVVAYAGPVEEGRRHLAAFQEPEGSFLSMVQPQPYVALQQVFDAGLGPGNRWYSRSTQMDELSDEAIDAFVDHLDPFPGEFTAVYFGPLSGAVWEAPENATAYPHRSSAHELHIFPGWVDPAMDGEVMAWADSFLDAMTPFGNGEVYVNLLGDGEEERVPAAFGANYSRLREIKRKWDPENVFRGNHNVPPAEPSAG